MHLTLNEHDDDDDDDDDIIIKIISALIYTVWHVDKYKITFKLVINHWTNEILVNDICYTDII